MSSTTVLPYQQYFGSSPLFSAFQDAATMNQAGSSCTFHNWSYMRLTLLRFQSSTSATDTILRSSTGQHSSGSTVHHVPQYASHRWDTTHPPASFDEVTRGVDVPGYTLPPIVSSSSSSVQQHVQPRTDS